MKDKIIVKETEDEKSAPVIPVHVPLSLLRWLAYSLVFSGALVVWYPKLVGWDGLVGTCLILGHFASQLNALINKK